MSRATQRHLFAVVAIVLATASIYARTLDAPFAFDDARHILLNTAIRVTALDVEQLVRAGFESPNASRPLANASFAVNYYYGGHGVRGYHVVNTVIHAAAAVFAYLLAFATIRLARRRDPAGAEGAEAASAWLPALFAGLVFAVHPVQTQAVTYVVQRMTSLSAALTLLALLSYVAGRMSSGGWKRLAWWLLGLVSWALALAAKQIAVPLPFVVLLYEWYFFRDLSWRWLARNAAVVAGAGVVLAAVALLFLGFDPGETLARGYAERDFTAGERVLTQLRVVVLYLGLLVLPLPSRLNLLHPVSTSTSLLDPATTLVCLLLLVGLLLLAIRLSRRHRLLSFCMLWFFAFLVIESSVVPLEMIYEHRLYLPMFGFALGLSTLLFEALAARRVLAVAIATASVLLLALGAYQRNVAWLDPVTLWSDVLMKNPQSERGFNNRGTVFEQRGQHELALRDFTRAIALVPDDPEYYSNRGSAYRKLGRHEEALADYGRAIEIRPELALAYNNRGNVHRDLGHNEHAGEDYTEAIRLDPGFVVAYVNRGYVRREQSDHEAALADFTAAIERVPDLASAHFARGLTRHGLGRLEGAESDYTTAIALTPDLAEAYLNRGMLREQRGEFRAAVRDYEALLQRRPDHLRALGHVAWVLATCPDAEVRDAQRALVSARRACELSGCEDPDLLETLAAAYAEAGEYDQAIALQERVLALVSPKVEPRHRAQLALYQQRRPYRQQHLELE